MRFSSFVFAALASLTIASPVVVERDAASVTSAIDAIESKVAILSTTVTGFKQGDIATALKIQSQTDDVNKAVDAATKTTSASAPLGSDSITVGLKVLNELKPALFNLLDLLVSKKSAFKNVVPGLIDVSFLVKYDLTQSKTKSDQFGAALISKLDPSLSAFAGTVISDIDAKFNTTIAAFS